MSALLTGSYVALWILVIFLTLALAALARQIGILYRRLTPAGARVMNAGPTIGERIVPFTGRDIYGRSVSLPLANQRPTLLMFLSPGCPMCNEVIPALKSVAQQEKHRLNIVLASFAGDESSNRSYVEEHGLSHLPYVFSFDLAHMFTISGAPYALVVDQAGILRTKGLVNNREHLDSLLNVLDGDYENIQAFWESRARKSESSGPDTNSRSAVDPAAARG